MWFEIREMKEGYRKIMYKNIVIIPALNPPCQRLKDYVLKLMECGCERILLVDDGSATEYKNIFSDLETYDAVRVFRHAINLGKGRALKDAFNYAVVEWGMEDCSGVITVDSDGQHTVEDVVALQKELDIQTVPTLLLGTRDFDDPKVPFKSRYGNKITSGIFKLLYGIKLGDTQTGLRAIPKEYMVQYMDLSGERFEYEMNMLIFGAIHNHSMKQIKIQTVYFDNNSETHFRPFVDSMKIYKLIFAGFFKYLFTSLSSAVIDLLIFHMMTLLLVSLKTEMVIIVSTVIARIVSSLYNFLLNRNIVFKSSGNTCKQMIQYYVLCIVQLCCSAGFVVLLDYMIGWDKTFEKIIVDSVLFVISYQIQRTWVFKEKR